MELQEGVGGKWNSFLRPVSLLNYMCHVRATSTILDANGFITWFLLRFLDYNKALKTKVEVLSIDAIVEILQDEEWD